MDKQTTFQIIPDRDELNQIERELRFFPATTTEPKKLTLDQVKNFNQQGFLSPIRIFDAAEIEDIRIYFDQLLAKAMAEGGDSYSISSAHLRHGQVYDILTDSRIVDCVSDLLGENVVAWGSHFFCKMPHDSKMVSWHQDASYWPITPSKTVTVWLAVDDADKENACVLFVPGSHLHGHLEFRDSDTSENNVLDQTIDNVEKFGTPFENILQAGEISLHSDLLLHGSNANHSDRRRCGLTLRYCTPDVRAHLEWNKKGVIVRGEDPNEHWGNPSRPQED